MGSMLQQLFQRSVANGSRATVITPLGWLVLAEFAGLTGCLKYGAPQWLLQWIGISILVTVAFYLVAYGFFAFKSPGNFAILGRYEKTPWSTVSFGSFGPVFPGFRL